MYQICSHRHGNRNSVRYITEGDLMAISFNSLVGHPLGQVGCQKMLKSSRNLNLLDFCSTFQPKVNKFQKTTRNREKGMVWGQFFEIHSLLAEK